MESPIEASPPVLLDSKGNRIENPSEMRSGNMFIISHNEPLALGEPVRNPFDVGPGLFDIPEIQGTAVSETDLLLVTVTEIRDEHIGTCRVEAEIKNAEKVFQQYENSSKIVSEDDFEIPDHGNPLEKDSVRGAMNKLLRDIR